MRRLHQCPSSYLPFAAGARRITCGIYPTKPWEVSSLNYNDAHLHWEAPKDDNSCGFYVLAVAYTLSSNTGSIPRKTFAKYDPSLTENLRTGCIKAFFKAFHPLSGISSSVSDYLIMSHLYKKISCGGTVPLPS